MVCILAWDLAKEAAVVDMKKEKNHAPEAQLLDLLRKVLPKATHDAALADKIFQAVQNELKAKAKVAAFEKFCTRVELPDLETKSIEAVKQQLSESFGDADLTVKADRKEKRLAVELALADGTQLTSEIKVNPNAGNGADGEAEAASKFAAFPVCLPGDKEMIWLLGKHENLSAEEAGMKLTRLQEDFWASKTGQKLLRDRVERNFPEFIARVPAGVLSDAGLKRHYKSPEPLKSLRVAKDK